jgi:hypothetical protein
MVIISEDEKYLGKMAMGSESEKAQLFPSHHPFNSMTMMIIMMNIR